MNLKEVITEKTPDVNDHHTLKHQRHFSFTQRTKTNITKLHIKFIKLVGQANVKTAQWSHLLLTDNLPNVETL